MPLLDGWDSPSTSHASASSTDEVAALRGGATKVFRMIRAMVQYTGQMECASNPDRPPTLAETMVLKSILAMCDKLLAAASVVMRRAESTAPATAEQIKRIAYGLARNLEHRMEATS